MSWMQLVSSMNRKNGSLEGFFKKGPKTQRKKKPFCCEPRIFVQEYFLARAVNAKGETGIPVSPF